MENQANGETNHADYKIDPNEISYCLDFRNTITKIVENYYNLEKSLVTQLQLETPAQPPTTGSYREEVWRGLFERMIPRKYCIEQNVFIMDSFGQISKEVDLAIFDEMYTPYIFNYGRIKFIPIEAVAVVIQCKSASLKQSKKQLSDWVESIACLKTSLDSALRVISGVVDNFVIGEKKKFQTSTRPVRILCSTITTKIEKEISQLFDITLSIEGDHLRKTIQKIFSIDPEPAKDAASSAGQQTKEEAENLDLIHWYRELNHFQLDRYKTKETEKTLYEAVKENETKEMGRNLGQLEIQSGSRTNVVMSLTFQLNQLLMMVNNPIPFPHRAYANLFHQKWARQEKDTSQE